MYYVSISGITGTGSANKEDIRKSVARLKTHTELPIAVGFGIKTPEQAAEVAKVADAVVVGSAIVQLISENIDEDGNPKENMVDAVLNFSRSIALGIRHARDRVSDPVKL
jgi:tryptophan synthase alpha chain